MDRDDPISQFFPGEESVDLYAVLLLKEAASVDDIKKSYRRLALLYHPDKYAKADEKSKADASTKFLQVGFAYAVLSDEKRRKRYDTTGMTDEGFELSAGEDGWEAYFEAMFDRVTRGKLDEMKKQYQGSIEEIEDIKDAYLKTGGSIAEIMNHIPHSTQDDEARFIVLISDLISKRDMPSLPAWESSVKDEKARLVRKKQGDKEAKEAEQLAKELGVWDEFYGSGKVGDRRSKGKGSSSSKKDGQGEEDTSGLQALILNKKKNMDSFFDSLAVKYSEPESKVKTKNGKNKKRNGTGEVDEFESQSPKKRRGQIPSPPEIDDEEFEKLQQKLFNDKPRSTAHASGSKSGRSGRSRKAK